MTEEHPIFLDAESVSSLVQADSGASSPGLRSPTQGEFTKGPWVVDEYDEHLGYFGMTGGMKAGPVYLDGAQYGQKLCTTISAEALARMTADAARIVHCVNLHDELVEALDGALLAITEYENVLSRDETCSAAIRARTALAKARGEK